MIKSLRNAFISGLLLLTPVAVTILVINVLVDSIGTPARDLFFPFLKESMEDKPWFAWTVSILSTFIVLILITLVGWFSQLLIGRYVVRAIERFLTNVPFIRTVYNTVKQIIDTFSSQNKAVFQKVVLLQFFRKDIYALGFLTGTGKEEIRFRVGREVYNIFVPTTPNPTSGFLVMVPKEKVILMDMPVADGMKLIISGGAVVPVYNKKTGQTEIVEVQNPTAAAAPAPAVESAVNVSTASAPGD